MSQAVAFSESPMAKRVPLAEQVPLEKPFAVRISPSCICNFRCEFCSQAIPEVREQFRNEGTKGLMEFSLFQKVIDDIADSFGRIKQLLLVGRGGIAVLWTGFTAQGTDFGECAGAVAEKDLV